MLQRFEWHGKTREEGPEVIKKYDRPILHRVSWTLRVLVRLEVRIQVGKKEG